MHTILALPLLIAAVLPWLSASPTTLFCVALFALFIAVLLLARRCSRVAWPVLLASLFALHSASFMHDTLLRLPPPLAQGHKVHLTGEVVAMPSKHFQFGHYYQRFVLHVEQCDCQGFTPKRVQLGWQREQDVIPGQRWQLQATLFRPRGQANLAGFDRARFLIGQQIDAYGRVETSGQQQVLGQTPSLDYWRWQLANHFQQRWPALNHPALIQALLLGLKDRIPEPLRQLFARSGVSHLMVISGLHISLVASLGFLLARSLSLLIPSAQWLPLLVGLLLAASYALLAGFSLPTQRALLMLMVVAIAMVLRRKLLSWQVLIWAALLCLWFDPLATLSLSFWLSFCAVGVILLAFASAVSGRRWWQAQWGVAIGLLPLLAWCFAAVPVQGVLVNLLAIPLFSVFLMPMMLLAVLLWPLLQWVPLLEPVVTFLWVYCDHLLSLFVDALWWCDQVIRPLNAYIESPLQWVLAVVGALLLLLANHMVARPLGVVLVLPLFIAKPHDIAHGEVQVGVLDVGQGLAVWLRTANHSLLYDVGASWHQGSQAQMTVVPVLQRLGVHRLDRLIISHGDNDHAGGVHDLLAVVPATSLQVGEPLPGLIEAGELCHQAKPWQWDGVWFEYFQVPEPLRNSGNNRSCVLRVSAGPRRLLLAGDIDRQAEQALVERYAQRLRADVLLSAHHGSNSSSSWLFLRHVAPSQVIHSAAYGNRFGHPSSAVVERFAALDVASWNTADVGAVTVTLTPSQAPRIQARRNKPRFFWHWHNN